MEDYHIIKVVFLLHFCRQFTLATPSDAIILPVVNTASNSKTTLSLPFFVALALVALFAIASLVGIPQLWGINLTKFFPLWVTYLACLILGFVSIPEASERLREILDKASLGLSGHLNRIILLIFSLLFVIFCFFFRSATNFLGDGLLRTNEITTGHWILPPEFLDFFLHAFLYNFVFHSLNMTAIQAYQAFSALCGILFVIGIWRLAGRLFSGHFLLAFLVMLSSGMSVLFFGYIESYSLIAAFLPWIFLAGFEATESPDRLNYFIWAYIVGLLVHSITFFLFTPMLGFLLMTRRNESENELRRISRWFVFSLAALVVIAYLCRPFSPTFIGRYLLPLVPTSNSIQGLLTLRHLLDLINWLFLASLSSFVLISSLLFQKKRTSLFTRQGLLAVWALAPSLLFMIFFVPQLGAPRDWDLFSLPSFVILMSSLAIFRAACGERLISTVIPVILLSFILTKSFITINNSLLKSIDRYAEIIEVGKPGNLFKEYYHLAGFSNDHMQTRDLALDFARKAWEAPPYKELESTLVLNELANLYLLAGKSDSADRYLNLSLSVDSLNLQTYFLAGNFYRTYGSRSELEDLANTMARRFSGNARGTDRAAILFFQLGDSAQGETCLRRAYVLDSSDAMVLVDYGVYLQRAGNSAEAIRLLHRATEKDPKYFGAAFNLAVVYANLGDKATAVNYLTRAEHLAATAADSMQVSRLGAILSR